VSAWRAAEFLQDLLESGATCIGEIAIAQLTGARFVLSHRDDVERDTLDVFEGAEAASRIGRFDDLGVYRPLKTAPNLRRGWRLVLHGTRELFRALDLFYPARLAVLEAFRRQLLKPTSLRETLDRQSGMYRVAARISDSDLNRLVGSFCRSEGGCLRTIQWKRDLNNTIPSTLLPPGKFDPGHDQTGRREEAIPLLCQEACNLLVAAARELVRSK